MLVSLQTCPSILFDRLRPTPDMPVTRGASLSASVRSERPASTMTIQSVWWAADSDFGFFAGRLGNGRVSGCHNQLRQSH